MSARDPGYTARYEMRKSAEKPLCVRDGKPAVPDSQLCARCLVKERDRVAAAMRKLRARRRKEKRKQRVTSNVTQGPTRTNGGVTQGVTQGAQAFPLVTDRTRRPAGQPNRGRPSQALIDTQDLEFAIDALNKAKHAFYATCTPEMLALPKYQREAAKRAALALVDHGARFIDEILDRNSFAGGAPVVLAADGRAGKVKG